MIKKKKNRMILLIFPFLMINFFVTQIPLLANVGGDEVALTPEIYNEYNADSKENKEFYKEKYLDENGNLVRTRLPIVIQWIISDNDETAILELEKLYTMGLMGSLSIPIGDKVGAMNFIHYILTMMLYFLAYIFIFLSFIVATLFPMLLVKIGTGELLADIFGMISRTLINGFLFKDTGASIGIFIIFLVTAVAIFRGTIKDKIEHPMVMIKQVLSIALVGIVGGFFAFNTIAYHEKIEGVANWAVEETIGVTAEETEIKQKSLIYILFQEQPFLMRNFGVVSMDDINNKCNLDGETPQIQYEGLLLGNGDPDGEDSYAIRQGKPDKCDNENIKHKDRIGIEFIVFLTSIINSTTNILLSFPISSMLVFIILLVIISFLRPLTALYKIVKNIFDAKLSGFFYITLNAFVWFLCTPIIKNLVSYCLLLFIKVVEMLQSINPFLTLLLGLFSTAVVAFGIKHIDKVLESLNRMVKNMTNFAIDGLNPDSNLLDSFSENIGSPALNSSNGMLGNVRAFFDKDTSKNENEEEKKRDKHPSVNTPKGDEDIVDDEVKKDKAFTDIEDEKSEEEQINEGDEITEDDQGNEKEQVQKSEDEFELDIPKELENDEEIEKEIESGKPDTVPKDGSEDIINELPQMSPESKEEERSSSNKNIETKNVETVDLPHNQDEESTKQSDTFKDDKEKEIQGLSGDESL